MTRPPGAFEVKDVDLAARIGRLYTKTGVVETPAFFPVIDVYRQEVPPGEIAEAGYGQAITNAYLTLRRFGEEALERGIHDLIGFPGVVMTDSGAYQMLEYGDVSVDQDTIIRYQVGLGSDISVILDVPTGRASYEEARRSVEETLRRAREALPLIRGTPQVWVLPVQGASYPDLVEESASAARSLDDAYQMYGIGGLTVYMEKYEYDVVLEAIYRAKRRLAGGKPVHLFGAGHPIIITMAAALGVDTFDSASYILYARDDRYITDYGVERLDRLEYFPCTCPVCSRYTPRDLLEMDKRERTRLLALHNLYAIRRAIQRVKQAIREGRLWEVLEETARRHPRAYEAFRRFQRYGSFLAASTPRVKGVVRGLRLYGVESTWRPKIILYRERIERYLTQGHREIILEPYPGDPDECRRAPRPEGEARVIYYHPYLGLVPPELCGVYPTIHVDHPDGVPGEALRETAAWIAGVLAEKYPGSRVVVRGGPGWRGRMARMVASMLSRAGVRAYVSYM